MSKPQPVRFDSSKCPFIYDGETIYPHEGEWVELFPIQTIGEMQHWEHLRQLQVKLNAAEGEPDEVQRVSQLMDAHMEELCKFVAQRIVAWNWTDFKSRPLPKPDMETLKLLKPEEAYWLFVLGMGETAEQRKKDLRPLQIISSATPQRQSRKRVSKGRNLTSAK